MGELVTKTDLQTAVGQIDAKIENNSLRMTVRLGVMLAAGIAVLSAVIKLS